MPATLHRPSIFLRCAGSISVVALLSLVIMSIIAANVLRTVLPRFHVSHQTAGWQEARLAADAGIDLALERLNKNVPDVTASGVDWTGWKVNATTAATGAALSPSNASAAPSFVATSNALIATPAIYLDNVDVSPVVGTTAAADVQIHALYPTPLPEPQPPWFRIRSMGTAGLPGPARAASDRMDTALRRLSLRGPMRPTLAANDILTPTTVPFPNASRIVEVIARPVTPFSKAIITEQDMVLGNSGGWQVNSYDSSDPNKSGLNGVYPGDSSAKIQSNGDIASNKKHGAPTIYAPLVDANGAEVRGNASTNGGDNPSTTSIHENITGAGGIDPTRIDDEFDDPLVAPTVPTPTTYNIKPNYSAGVAFAASGDPSTEYYYRVYASDPALGSFRVSGTGRITIIIDGDLNLGNGAGSYVEIPPNVYATIYVKGNIDFGNGLVNTTAASSKKPGNLIIYGAPTPNADGSLPVRTLNSEGNPEIAAAFYGPSYRVSLRGTAEWYGAVAAASYTINGGGSGGFHYDEALGGAGFIEKFVIVSSFEDSRQ
jgi:hypothetical protein